MKDGEFEARKKGDKFGEYPNDRWEPPEQEAHQLTNMVFLDLIELIVEDLATVENELEPPINISRGGTKQANLDKGIEGEFNNLESFFKRHKGDEWLKECREQYEAKGTLYDPLEDKFERYKRNGHDFARNIRLALGTDGVDYEEDPVDDGGNGTDRREQERYKQNMGVLFTVKMAERHLEFIIHLAEWEHEKFGLNIEKGGETRNKGGKENA